MRINKHINVALGHDKGNLSEQTSSLDNVPENMLDFGIGYDDPKPPNGGPINILTAGNTTKQWYSTKEQYDYPWDPMGEMIQNSVLAIMDLDKSEYDKIPEDEMHIEIEIDQKNRRFSVLDRGVGFPGEKYLALPQTTREEEPGKIAESGMGIGLSASLARTSSFKMTTRNKSDGEIVFLQIDQFCEHLLEEAKKELQGEEPDMSFAKKEFKKLKNSEWEHEYDAPASTFTLIESGGNHSEGLGPMWDWIDKFGVGSFKMALQFHTALGHRGAIHGKPLDREIRWSAKLINGKNKSKVTEGKLNDNQLFKAPKKHSLVKVTDKQITTSSHLLTYEKKGAKSPNPAENPTHLVINTKMLCANRKGGREFLKGMYGEFLTHEDEPDENKVKGVQTPLVFLSINGFPQPFRIEFTASSNRTVDRWTVVFIDVDQNVVDNGRRAVKDAFRKQLTKWINGGLTPLNTKYNKDSKANKNKSGKTAQTTVSIGSKTKKPFGDKVVKGLIKPTVDQTLEIEIGSEVVNEEEEQEEPEAFESILLKTPANEVALNYLFVDCISKGVLPGFKISGSGDGSSTLDLEISPEWPFSIVGEEHQEAIKKEVKKEGKTGPSKDSKLSDFKPEMVLESKVKLTDLVTDLIKNTKQISEIDIAICWDISLSKPQLKKKYRLEQTPNSAKWHPGVSHTLDKEDNPSEYIQIIDMSRFMQILSEEE